MKVKRQIITGVCRCGHSWEEHHLGMMLNLDYWEALQKLDPNHPPYVAQECEHYGSNEHGGLDAEGKPHCGHYEEALT